MALIEKICLEGFQAGLSWITILRRRPGFREAFHGFAPAAVAALGDEVISPNCLWCLQDGFVARAHEEGLGVLPWTVNEPADLAAVREAGVDGLVTDYPDRVALPRPA